MRIDFTNFAHKQIEYLDASRGHLFEIQARMDEANRHLKDIVGIFDKVKFAQHGINETAFRPTMYMAGERRAEQVSIQPTTQQPSFSIQSTPVKIYLDSREVALGVIQHFPQLSKAGHMKIHPRAQKEF